MNFLFFRQDESLLEVSKKEQTEAIEKLIGATTMRKGYYLLLSLAILIVTSGLLIDNAGVIIGGMVLAPLLMPILLLALSIVTRSTVGIFHAVKALVISVVLTLALSSGLTWILARSTATIHWIPQEINPPLYVFIAFCSGIAAAFAWVKKDLAPAIAGIAIAVSLLPPLCAAGSALVFRHMELATSATAIFSANVFGIVLGAVIVFLLLGFFPTKKLEEKAIAKV